MAAITVLINSACCSAVSRLHDPEILMTRAAWSRRSRTSTTRMGHPRTFERPTQATLRHRTSHPRTTPPFFPKLPHYLPQELQAWICAPGFEGLHHEAVAVTQWDLARVMTQQWLNSRLGGVLPRGHLTSSSPPFSRSRGLCGCTAAANDYAVLYQIHADMNTRSEVTLRLPVTVELLAL